MYRAIALDSGVNVYLGKGWALEATQQKHTITTADGRRFVRSGDYDSLTEWHYEWREV